MTTEKEMTEKEFYATIWKAAKVAAIGLFALVLIIKTFETVPEGHVAVVKRFSKAVRQLDPGLNVLIPFIEDTIHYDVREKKVNVSLASATREQLPITTEISFNWRIDAVHVIEVFQKYGSPALFYERIVQPRVAQSAKETFGKFSATDLIQKREVVAQDMRDRMALAMEDFPVLSVRALSITSFCRANTSGRLRRKRMLVCKHCAKSMYWQSRK